MFDNHRKECKIMIEKLKKHVLNNVKDILSLSEEDFKKLALKCWTPMKPNCISIKKSKYVITVNKSQNGFVATLFYKNKEIPCLLPKDNITLNQLFEDITYAYYYDRFEQDINVLKEFFDFITKGAE